MKQERFSVPKMRKAFPLVVFFELHIGEGERRAASPATKSMSKGVVAFRRVLKTPQCVSIEIPDGGVFESGFEEHIGESPRVNCESHRMDPVVY